jgi:SAM-dependent methyltransferase
MLMNSKTGNFGQDSKYWDSVPGRTPSGQHYDAMLADHYRNTHLKLLERWTGSQSFSSVLKTDLFAEAVCPSRSFTWEMLRQFDRLTGIDISCDICGKAKEQALLNAAAYPLETVNCDVRKLPFAGNSFDLVISDSTLDHFALKADIDRALQELMRVVKPGGTLIVTMDNGGNVTEPLFRLWIALGLAPFFIGKTYSMRELCDAIARTGLAVAEKATIVHNPRFFTKLMVTILRKIQPGQADNRIKRLLDYFDSLETKTARYLTAQYIAVKAVKPLSAH